jgi:hypothetical protein
MPADALPNFANCDERAGVIAALDDVAAELKAHVQKPYHFRFPSQLQAKPFEQAFYKWVAGGRVGPQPPADPASLRAAMYNQGTAASALAAFHRVMCVISVEFAESSAYGFRKGQLTVPCAALRSLIERIAHTVALSDAVKGMPTAPISPDTPLKTVLELGQVIAKALYGTQQNWTKLTEVDFREASHKDVAYIIAAEDSGIKATNVLGSIDKLEKRVPGTRLTYEVLCEFLHPNRGDLYGATIDARSLTDHYGMRHLERAIGLGPKSLAKLPDLQVVTEKMLDVSADIVRHLPTALDEIETVSVYATKLTRGFAHKMVKQNRGLFANRDLCPCLSGLTIKDCMRSKLL